MSLNSLTFMTAKLSDSNLEQRSRNKKKDVYGAKN